MSFGMVFAVVVVAVAALGAVTLVYDLTRAVVRGIRSLID